MKGTLKLATALTAIPLSTNAIAASTQSPCLTEQEAVAFFSFALPEMLNTVADKCQRSLPTSSFLSAHAKELVASYRTASTSAWPRAKAAFFKLGGEDNSDGAKLLRAMPDDTLKSVVGTAFNVVVGNDRNSADCSKIDSLVAALAPLPISNVATILVSIGGLVGSEKNDSFRICPNN
jgi:hypothetical protein